MQPQTGKLQDLVKIKLYPAMGIMADDHIKDWNEGDYVFDHAGSGQLELLSVERNPARTWINSAAILTAISSGLSA